MVFSLFQLASVILYHSNFLCAVFLFLLPLKSPLVLACFLLLFPFPPGRSEGATHYELELPSVNIPIGQI